MRIVWRSLRGLQAARAIDASVAGRP